MALARPPLAFSALAVLAIASLQGCGPLEDLTSGGPAGPSGPAGTPPPAGFATDMVDAHNAVRADPSSVRGSPVPAPALAPLGWSDAAAATAQAWADGCTWAHNPGRGSFGENIAAAAPPGSRTPADVVQRMWAAEAPFYDYGSNACNTANPPNRYGTCGHYTQLVWRSTTAVGCGFKTCTTGSPFGSGSWDYWVCDYAPPGNYLGQRPY